VKCWRELTCSPAIQMGEKNTKLIIHDMMTKTVLTTLPCVSMLSCTFRFGYFTSSPADHIFPYAISGYLMTC
jgi:hypothetical protein